MKRTCVIGGTGFIGSYVVEILQSLGRRVTVVGRNSVPTRPMPKDVLYRAGDYGDVYFLRGVLKDVDEVIALAHTTVPKTSFDDPVSDILGNLTSAVKLFETALSFGIHKLVFVSSGGTIYGKAGVLPLNEQSPVNPISPYGITKLAIEKYALMFHVTHGLPVLCVRPANAYGPGQTPFSGQGLVATVVASLLNGREILSYGAGTTIRDYVHVSDMASGIVAALDQGKVGECYNIGSGFGVSSKEVIESIAVCGREAGFDAAIRVLPERSFDVPANILDSSKLMIETGWTPKVNFDEGICATWRWYADNLKRDTLCG